MIIHNLIKFHENRIVGSPLVLLTDKYYTDRQTDKMITIPIHTLWEVKKDPQPQETNKDTLNFEILTYHSTKGVE